MKGIFITFEGPDGSGKSTISNLVLEHLEEELKGKVEIVKTREPGGTEISEKIRDMILDVNNSNMTYRTEALLYAASRAQHVEEKIVPALNDGKIVICERFVLSSIAYQGYGRGLGEDDINLINNFATGGLKPDITFLFDTKGQSSVQRKIEMGGDRLEISGDSFHKRVNDAYKELSTRDSYYIIDATKSIEEVLKSCLNILKVKLGGII